MSLKKSMLTLILSMAAAGVTGCSSGSDVTEIDCSTTTVPSFSEVTIWPKCTNCHATTLSGSDRNAAPEDINFDDYDSAVANAEDAMAEVAAGDMPLTGSVTEEEKQSLYAWVQCGTPE